MRRRDFIAGLGIAAAWPSTGRAQLTITKPYQIGVLTRKTDASVSSQIDAFRQRLHELGWVEGRNVGIVYRDADGVIDRLRVLADELVTLNVDLIVTVDTPPTQAASDGRNSHRYRRLS